MAPKKPLLHEQLETGDASLDEILNGVWMPGGEIVAWAIAFPRPD